MELSQLEAFVRVATEGNVTRAADLLGITQPAVTARLQALEATLKGKLFERDGRALQLTPLGQHFLPHTQRIITFTQDARQVAYQYQQGIIGQVRVAAPTPFLMSFLLPALLQFRQKHPNIDVFIRERNKTIILDLLQDNLIHLGLVNGPIFDTTMQILALFQDEIIPVAASSHWLTQTSQPLHMVDIMQYPILRVSLFPRMTAFMDDLAEQSRHANGGAIVALPMVLAYELALMGQGITFLPKTYVQSSLDAQRLVHLKIEDMPELHNEVALIKLRQRPLDQAHQHFVDILCQLYQPLRLKTP